MHEQMKRLYEAARVMKRVHGQSELARLLNVSPQTVHNWQARGISKQGILKAQEMIGCSASWLETGKGQMSLNALQIPHSQLGKINQIPMISDEQVFGFNSSSRNPVQFSEQQACLFTHLSLSPRSFAMKIENAAMMPDFEEGDWIVIDPSVKPDPGDFVVARNGEKGKVVVRKYRPKGLDSSHRMLFELLPLNEDYPVIRSHIDSVELIGTVMEHRKFRKK